MNTIKVYDKAKYHRDSKDFPEGLPSHQALVHTGLFWGWLMDNDLISHETRADFPDVIDRFRRRDLTGPRAYAIVGGALASDMLNEEGQRFADDYFDFDRGAFIQDYLELLASGLPSNYHVADTWDNYTKLKERIDRRYQAWKRSEQDRGPKGESS